MSIRTTVDAPDIRPDAIGPEHLRSDPGSLGKITGEALRLFGDSIVIGTGKSLTHGSTVIVGSDAKVPWSALKNHVSITAGEGLAGGGSLSGNVTLSVDSTVVRTTGNYTLSGTLTLSNSLIVSGSGRIGIGTTSPEHALHIEETAPVIRLHSARDHTEGSKIRFTENLWRGAYIHYEGSANRLDIGVHEAADTSLESDTPVISITRSTQRVGIGTTNPSYPLHVSGDIGFSGVLQQGTVPWARLSGYPSITAGTGLSGGGSLSASRTLSVVYGSTAGTAVEGNKQITVTAGANLSGGGTITLGSGGSVSLSVVNDPTFSGSVTTPLVTSTGTLALTGSGSSGTIVFSTNGAERMRITSQGRVGIGTTAPSYALHVAGDVGFSGTLQQGTVPWARLSGHPSITAGTGLTGGGSLSSSRTLSVNFGSSAGTVAEGNKTITVTAGDGLSGGGTVTIGAGGSITISNADRGSAQNIFKRIANSSGTVQFSAGSNNDILQFGAGTGISVSFDATNKRITYSHALKAGTGINISGDTIANTGIISLSAGSGISVSGSNPATITNTDRGSDQSIFKNIANSSGTTQFSAGSNNDTIRFAAGGILSVSFNSTNKQVTYSASLTAGTNITVSGAQISTVSNPTFSTSVTTPSLISTSNLSLTAQGANNIIFVTNNTERMRIASSGNVGIKTSSPAEALHVQGRVLISSTGHETAGHLQVERVHNEQGNKLKVVISSDPGWQTGLLPNRSISLLSQEAASIALGFEDGQILPLVVSSQGRVGIGGKVSPQYALDVTGDVAFSGTLQAGNIPAARITSGTLGVARGGTGRSSLASGQILFGAGTSAVGLDSNLYWDNSNKRLGVGTSGPQEQLHVTGKIRTDEGLRISGFEIVYNESTESLDFLLVS